MSVPIVQSQNEYWICMSFWSPGITTLEMGMILSFRFNQNLKFFLKNLDTMSSRVNKGGTIQLVISTQFWGLQQHMLSSRFCLFQGHPCTFQQDNVKLHTLPFRKVWRCSRSLNCPVCAPDLWFDTSSVKKIHQRRCPTSIRQEPDNILLPIAQQLVSVQFPDVCKRRGEEEGPIPTFLTCVTLTKRKMSQ